MDVQGDALSSFRTVCWGPHTAGINWGEGKELLGYSHMILHTPNSTQLPTTAEPLGQVRWWGNLQAGKCLQAGVQPQSPDDDWIAVRALKAQPDIPTPT